MAGFEKILIPLGRGVLILARARSVVALDDSDTNTQSLPQGWLGEPHNDNRTLPPIQVKEDGVIRLVETYSYEWAYESDLPEAAELTEITSPLEAQRQWKVRQRKGGAVDGSFQIVNYLGYSKLQLNIGEDEIVVPLEFISKKLDFDQEYRRMTEDIAEFCEQLLLSTNTPTSLTFSAAPEEKKKLTIESFFFLRHFLNEDKLALLLEHIQRNPHRTLTSEKEWRPVGRLTSADHLGDPNSMLREWRRAGGNRSAHEGVQVTRQESFDTPVNQFVLFALSQFRKLAAEVSQLSNASDSIQREAEDMVELLDAVVSRPFFKGISRLQKLPLNNQTLQKREGYREILRGWILVESASTLNWDGRKECYQGNTKDVATLYEYWIFLELHKLLAGIPGVVTVDEASPESFIQEGAGGVSINLVRGKNSRTKFKYTLANEEVLNVTLHYELTFRQESTATSGKSYSRQFRPDYTLALYSDRFSSEQEATKNGAVRHLHFDAKYRVANVQKLFGGDGDDELTQEKANEKATSNYQRGDLLKMHTYNDALRKTIGSYVLYPGEEAEGHVFNKFNEIAPGVGAHVMKPGRTDCRASLQAFIHDILNHQANQFTQFSYLDEVSHTTYADDPSELNEKSEDYIARPEGKCVMLWVPEKREELYKQYGFAYCKAITGEKDEAINLDLTTEVGSEFIPIKGGRGQELELAGWRAKITEARFIAKEQLSNFIHKETGIEDLPSSETSHYILYKFTNNSSITVRNINELHKRKRSGKNIYMAVTCNWADIIAG